MPTQNPNPITWQAPEFREYQKSAGWYMALFIFSLIVVGFFVWQKDYFAAVCLAVMAGFIWFFAKQTPETIQIEINTRHIRFGNLIFPYQQIKHFWVVQDFGHKTLNLHTTAMLNNIIILELQDQDPEAVRAFLLRYVPEHTEVLPTVPQRIMSKLRF